MVGEILEFKISQESSLGGKKVYDASSGHAHGLLGCMKRLWRQSGNWRLVLAGHPHHC